MEFNILDAIKELHNITHEVDISNFSEEYQAIRKLYLESEADLIAAFEMIDKIREINKNPEIEKIIQDFESS